MPDALVHSGAMLGFKVGTQQSVDTMLTQGGATHGTFYLATDTHRLYIGNEDTSLSPVNEGIQTVSDVAHLPSISAANRKAKSGEFYYAEQENILCVYNGTNWVQLNSNTDTSINTITTAVSGGTVTTTVTEKDKDGQATGRSIDTSFSVTGANGITISGTGTALTVSGNTYSIGAAVATTGGVTEATITLDSANSTVAGANAPDSSFKIKAGNNVQIATSGTSDIQISATDTHNNIDSVTIANNTTSGFDITVSETEGSSDTATLNPTISYGTNSTATFQNGIAALDVYTKGEIDNKMQAVNAMHYRGTIGTNGTAYPHDSLSTSSFNLTPPLDIGDTFKLSTSVTINNVEYPANSIIIANGTEGSDGHIQQNSLTFDIIQATEFDDTTYLFESDIDATNDNAVGVVLAASTGNKGSSFRIKAGTGITATGSGTQSDSNQVVTVAHANLTAISGYSSTNSTEVAQSPCTTTTIYPITGVTVNAQGHVTGVERSEVVLTDTNMSIDDFTISAGAVTGSVGASGGNKVTVTETISSSQGSGASNADETANFSIASDNLTITTGSNNEIRLNLVWGSF